MPTKTMFHSSVLCLAMAAAFPASADDEVEQLIRPESSVTLGVGGVSTDNQRFGAYNGMAENGEHLIGEASIVRRDDASATWFRLDARNLGLTTRELRLDHERQGDWGYYLEYSQTPRVAPYDVHTGVTGIGTATQTVPNALGVRSTAGETELRTDRYKTTLGYYKTLTAGWDFNVKFQSEEKQGSRLFGRGNFGGSVQEFLAEPIDSTTRQLDMTLDYVGDRFQMQAGYYGSFYNNRNSALLVSGGNANVNLPALNPPLTVIALPPDNLAHQLHASGAYDFTRTTRGTFRYSYTKNTQTDAFVPLPAGGVNLSGRSDLGGRVDTTLFQFGVTSRPMPKLSLLANLRYEDRDDKTVIAQYVTAGGSTDGYNEPRSLKIVSGKFEATYQLPQGVRATGGLDVENKQRSMSGLRAVAYREKTEETSWRFELRRSLFDAVTGAVGIVHSNRNGSAYPTMYNFNGTLYSSGGVLQPIYIADRDRNKFKASADWSPIEALSLQFLLEDSRDRYGAGRGNPDVGPRSGDAQLYSVDASYVVSDKWQLTAYVSELKTKIGQSTGSSAATYWTADMRNTGLNYGFGAKGKPSGKLEIGADLLFAEDLTSMTMAGTPVTAGQLPDINNVQTTFKLFANYAWDKDTDVRLDYVHDRRKTNDWTWNGTSTPYVYTDGTWLYQNPNETVNFLGVSVKYSFR